MSGRYSIRSSPFVLNLVKILSEPNYSHIISWEWSGTSFIIKDSIEFASKVLPQYYETSKLASFTRQLNIYGFEKISDRRRTKQSGVTSWMIYSHQYFKRDQPDSFHLIQRLSGPYSKVRTKSPILGRSQNVKCTLLPSPLSPMLSSAPRVCLHSISPEECESVCMKDTVVKCSSCTVLRGEVATLSKMIECYKSLIVNPAIHMNIPSNNSDICAIDIAQSLISSFTVAISPEEAALGLWANSDPNVYSYIYPYSSPMENTQWQ